MQQQVEKPIKRGRIRKFLGKEYFILKRKLKWYLGNTNYSAVNTHSVFDFSIITHQSVLLRPLKDVDMQLQHNKVVNLAIAIKHLDKVEIKPGETFSIWKLVGRPNKRKGYIEGMTLHNGRVLRDVGGGLCQLGNLIYWMALHSPLTIKERWRHGFDVFPDINRTIPFACGATLSYNYVDLQLENNTDFTFQLSLWLDDSFLKGEIKANKALKTSYEIYETDHSFQQQWWGGYTRHNRIWKKITNLITHEVTEELVAENNAIMMYSPLLDVSNEK